MPKSKRHLSDNEVSLLKQYLKLPKVPSVRALAKIFGVNQPAIIKAVNLWKGIQRKINTTPQIKLISAGMEDIDKMKPTEITDINRSLMGL